ncbi:MAG TPA: mechanosensitive ion channel domain-containing protein [Woeseiaceae bacterium]|nr:mechanosensitive ion channel domain-containing protein [Woeseiaceae bacterium]
MNETELAELGAIWTDLVEKIQTTGFDLAINLVAALAIFLIGRMVVGLVDKGVRRLMRARSVDPILESFVASMLYWGLMAFVVIAAITKVGIQTASLIAVVGAAGLAVGLALQGSLANFAAGVLIVIFRPYRVGDVIEAAGIIGSVAEVQLLTTILNSGDNKQIVVPNGQIMESIITNYSAYATRRVDLVVGVSYGDDIDKVRDTIRELVDADERIHKNPECEIVVGDLAESSVNFNVRPWVDNSDYWEVKFDLTEKIKKRFDEVGISIPYPQRDVHIIRGDA